MPIANYSIKTSTQNANFGGVTVTTQSGRIINIDDSFMDYLDIISSILGIEDYETFSNMSKKERIEVIKKYKRDIKLQEILK